MAKYLDKSGLSTTWSRIKSWVQSYVTAAIATIDLSNYYTKSEIDAMIGNINSILEEVNGEMYP